MKHCMIDTETLGLKPDAKILSIGAVMFDPREDELGAEFYAVFDRDSQPGRVEDEGTIAWWAKQSEEAKAALTRTPAIPMPTILKEFRDWWGRCGAKYPWANGAAFDIPLLENAYDPLSTPWKFYHVRDTRTIYWLGNTKPIRSTGHHDALEDAKAQALAVIRAYRLLKEAAPWKEPSD
jgi:hypothetical protein